MPVITLSTAPLLLLPLFIPAVLAYFFQVRPRRRLARELHLLQQSLRAGDRIITGSGLHATVVNVDVNMIDLEVRPGATHRYNRTAVVQVLEPTSAAGLL